MKAPYPWFGGKSRIMPEVWRRLGDTYNFVDPFLGSNAPLLSRNEWGWETGYWRDGKSRIETVNDKDCFVANFQRALKHDPDNVAHWADDPVNEADLHARHLWLVQQDDFIERMMTDPEYYDVKVAGWWIWGICQWIGGEWCKMVHRRRPHLGDSGRGVHRVSQLPHLLPGRGIHRQSLISLQTYFQLLSARLRRVRVCCGDWTRVLGPSPTYGNGLTAIILDPPYGAKANRDQSLYNEDSLDIANDVREWALENGNNPQLRIALFGYEDEHQDIMPNDWECLAWKPHGGFGHQRKNGDYTNNAQERIWFSPHCLQVKEYEQMRLV